MNIIDKLYPVPNVVAQPDSLIRVMEQKVRNEED